MILLFQYPHVSGNIPFVDDLSCCMDLNKYAQGGCVTKRAESAATKYDNSKHRIKQNAFLRRSYA